MVMLGGLRPFLFWANRDWFNGADAAWTGLLAAQGAGALIGAVVSALAMDRLRRLCSAYTLAMAAGILEGLAHLLLLFPTTAWEAMAILALAGIPEIVSTAAWFTAAQIRLPTDRQAILFTYSAPLWDLAFAAGTFSGGLHADGILSLSAYWALVSLTATLPLGPLLAVRRGKAPSA
jgi:Transmembrane secretion effector